MPEEFARAAVRPSLERDFVGYGRHPPDPHWPGGARLAVNFVVNYEEGSERSIGDGDGVSEAAPEMPSPVARGRRDLAAESMFQYGSRVGFWRLRRLFRERHLPFTLFACAQAIERNPEVSAAVIEDGTDICCHGWRWAQHFDMAEAEERTHIERAVASLRQTVGRRPQGWYCRFAPGENTRQLLAEEGGFLYDSDAYDDELPYWVSVGERLHLVIPYSLTNNDGLFSRAAIGTSEEFFTFLRDAFDLLHGEGATRPKMMSIGLHGRIAGHPARAAGLSRFLDYVMRHPDVWVCDRLSIAHHWHRHHRPEGWPP